jgi:hypothetical protein
MPDPNSLGQHESELDFTVEPLDGRALSQRLRRPSWLTRLRVGIAALTLVLVGVYLLLASGLAGQWWQQGRLAVLWHFAPRLMQTTIVPAAPGTLPPPSAWQRIPLPPTVGWVLSLDVSPTNPQAALACTGPKSDPTALQPTDGPIGLWRTSDGGQHWQPLPIPARIGSYCQVLMAAGTPQRLLLNVSGSGGCQASHPLLSMDGGQHWRSLSPALPALPALPEKLAWCSLSAAVGPRHVFASVDVTVQASVTTTEASAGSGGTSFNYQTSEWTTRSDTDGQTWTAPAITMQSDAILAGSAGGDDLPFTATDLYSSPDNPAVYGTRFWTSSDLGDSWQPQAVMPGFAAQRVMASPGVTLANATASRPVYALNGTEIPWESFRIQAAQISGHTWALVPPLPVSGATAAQTGITVVLSATPSGKLMVLGLAPHTTLPTGGSLDDLRKLTQWLWEWDPVAARWNAITPLPANAWPSHCSTPCWHGSVSVGADSQSSGPYLWLTDGGAWSEAPMLLRLRLPAGV